VFSNQLLYQTASRKGSPDAGPLAVLERPLFPRHGWSLPFRSLVLLTLFRITTFIPAAILAGALTPVDVDSHNSSTRMLHVPQYSNASLDLWGDLTWLHPMPVNRTAAGVFSYSPNYDMIGLIRNEAASATKSNNGSQAHKKPDNTRYSFTGRSFGVGSSAGLVDQGLSRNTTLSYNYNETGHLTQASCIVNVTSDWRISGVFYPDDGTYPNLYLANGTHSNSNRDHYAACGLHSSDDIFALAGSHNDISNSFSIATGRGYSAFDKVQCTVDFKPTVFSIAVDHVDLLINLSTALQNSTLPRDIEPMGKLINITMRMPICFLSSMHVTSTPPLWAIRQPKYPKYQRFFSAQRQ